VGLAIGTGTDVAIESSDITLMSGALSGLVTAIDLSRATMRNIRQNLVFAFAYNTLGIPIAAGVLYPVLGLTLSPVIAAAAMALSSLSVVTNANRLRRFRAATIADRPVAEVSATVEIGPREELEDTVSTTPARLTDPVCGMAVDPGSAAARQDHAGTTYYFCSRHCADAFAEDPARFVTASHRD
jgi:Cu+-exporting ATPase